MKKVESILKIMLLIIILTFVFQSTIYAGINTNGVVIGGTSQISSSNERISKILGIGQLLGSIASVIALAVIGLRYMFSSVEEQAKMKGVLIYYIVGAVLVFATSNVLSVVYKVMKDITF